MEYWQGRSKPLTPEQEEIYNRISAKQEAKEAVKEFLEEVRDRTYGVTIRTCPHCGKQI